MDGSDIEHRTEIRRANRATPLWLGIVVVAVILGVVLTGTDHDAELTSPITRTSPPTSETLTTTTPPAAPPVYGVARGVEADGGLVPAWSASDDLLHTTTGPRMLDRFSRPVVTAGRVAVLGDDATLFAGAPGEPFTSVECCFDELVPSNEPHHVWGRWIDEAALVDLDVGRTRIRIPLDGDAIVGPASFGLVTVGPDGSVRWRRPSFDPLDLPIPADREVLDSGGELVLVASTLAPDRVRYELWSITDGGVTAAHEVTVTPAPSTSRPGSAPPAGLLGGVLASDGSVVALRGTAGWEVLDSAGGTTLDVLPDVDGPVWIGRGHFAVLGGPQIVVSELDPPLPGRSFVQLAERSPEPS